MSEGCVLISDGCVIMSDGRGRSESATMHVQ